MTHHVTSESVTEGHPDKICDQVSDAILDDLLRQDPESRVAVETLATTGLLMIAGEVRTEGYADVERIARGVLERIGYTDPAYGITAQDAAVLTAIHEQSPDIARGVDPSEDKELGAGDQGIMFGYATDETPEYLPLPISLAHRLAHRLAQVRKDGTIEGLGPDGKTQVTVEYDGRKPLRVSHVVISSQHRKEIAIETVRQALETHVARHVLANLIDDETLFHINPSGPFIIGGPQADTGLTGRKIIIDTYGGGARHGGGAFSGKDPSKVDRSAAYAARYVAKNLVAAGLAQRCEIQLSYAIGISEPLSIAIETFGTSKAAEDELVAAVRAVFDLSPAGIIRMLDLKKPVYERTAAYGHFGREGFRWEQLDKTTELRRHLS
ncbi:MAG: methionine adenosyltransferase [Candidatus Woesearchaeota archaeon]